MVKRLKDLFKGGKKEEVVNVVNEEVDEQVSKVCFHIPSRETIKALSSRQPLTEAEIDDYIEYIKKNYFVAKANTEALFQFCGEYILFANDETRFNARANNAFENVKENLAEGSIPNIIDALWISTHAYVDDVYVDSRRIVTKTTVDGKHELDVRLARTDASVLREISDLKSQLKKVATKEVENIL